MASTAASGDLVREALTALRSGRPVNLMISEGRGLVCVAAAPSLVDRLELPQMVQRNSDSHGTAFTVSVDVCGTGTGISAADRAATIRALADPKTRLQDLRRPGRVFPLRAVAGGTLERRGHTEAAVELATMAGLIPAAATCEVLDHTGASADRTYLSDLAARLGLPMLHVGDIARAVALGSEPARLQTARASIPNRYGTWNAVADLGTDGVEHLALVLGDPTGARAPLVRMHSECLTGDVLGSRRCDRGEQLDSAMATIAAAGTEIVVYLRGHEGRGIGLLDKIRAYALQKADFDGRGQHPPRTPGRRPRLRAGGRTPPGPRSPRGQTVEQQPRQGERPARLRRRGAREGPRAAARPSRERAVSGDHTAAARAPTGHNHRGRPRPPAHQRPPPLHGRNPRMLPLVDSGNGTVVGRAEGEDVVLDVQTAGSGPTLLLLHGVEGREADASLVDALAERFMVVAPSHPGFGLSPRPDWCDSVEDLAYLYLEWLEQQDLNDVVVVGLQFGGWIAAELAVRDCSRIGRLVLVDPVGIKVGGRQDRDIADVFAISRAELDSRHYADPAAGPGDLSQAPREEVLHIARNEEALALYGWEPYLHNPRLRRWLPRIHVPTLVTWGAQDGIVSPEYGRAYADSIPGARFELLDGAGHRAQIEQPDTLAKLIAEHSA